MGSRAALLRCALLVLSCMAARRLSLRFLVSVVRRFASPDVAAHSGGRTVLRQAMMVLLISRFAHACSVLLSEHDQVKDHIDKHHHQAGDANAEDLLLNTPAGADLDACGTDARSSHR